MFKSNLKLVSSNKNENLQDKKIKIRKGLILKLRADGRSSYYMAQIKVTGHPPILRSAKCSDVGEATKKAYELDAQIRQDIKAGLAPTSKSFDIELDNKTGRVKSVFNVKNGRRTTKLPKKEATQKVKTLSETVELRKNVLNRELQESSVRKIDEQLISNRGGRLANDELLKTKEAYRNKDVISAADESRGSLYNTTAKDTDKMIAAVLSQPVFKKRQLDDLGIIYKKDTGELIIKDTARANKDS